MIKRTIEISGHSNHLFLSDGSLCIRRGRQEVGRIPLEDLGLLVLDAPSTTYTHAMLCAALDAGAGVLLCGKDHHPCGLFLPRNHSLLTQRTRAQANASLPLRKQLWKQIVRTKITAQAGALPEDSPVRHKLNTMVATVRSGDPSNVEAHAARAYWPALLGKDFRRARDGAPPNNLLNYGYMVLRASVARAVCAAGLSPVLGLHHSNRSNAFCLADDLLEPLRPLIDRATANLHASGIGELDRDVKTELLSLLTAEVEVAGEKGPLMVALERTTASLVRCYEGQQKRLDLPKLWN